MDGAKVRGLRRLEHFTGRSLAGLLAVLAVGSVFSMLLLLVRFNWQPLYRVDHDVANELNDIMSANKTLVLVMETLTDLGGRPIMMWLVIAVIVGLLIRGRRRLAAYLAVTGIGALMLDPSLKLIVGRLRPVVDAPVASAPGNSFPSGHALGATVAYGALLLVFLPAVSRRWRPVAIGIVAAIVLIVGITRIALGVHYLSDVIAGWMLGIAWLGVTGYAFRLWRREAGQPAPPISEGIEPEAAKDVAPAPQEHHVLPHPRSGVAEILTGWVLVFGILFVFGWLISRYTDGTVIATVDDAVPQWFADHRTLALNDVSWLLSKAGDTHSILAVSLVFCPLALAILRRWRPVVFVALAMIGEVTLFLALSRAVQRERPEVPLLDGTLPTSSFPSGHIAATICLYTAIALIVMPRTDRWWRWLTVAAAIILPIAVAVSRLYRGMHHPTDVLGAILLSALWIGLLWWVVRPDLPDEDADEAPADRADTSAVGTPAAADAPGDGKAAVDETGGGDQPTDHKQVTAGRT